MFGNSLANTSSSLDETKKHLFFKSFKESNVMDGLIDMTSDSS